MDSSSSSSIPRLSGIPRPSSRLPVLKPSASQSSLRSAPSSDQLRKKTSNATLSKPAQPVKELQKKPSRTSLSRTSISNISNSARASLQPAQSITKRGVSNVAPKKPSSNDGAVFKKPIGRPVSRQLKRPTTTSTVRSTTREEDDGLGALEGFRSSSRASSRQGFRELEQDYAISSEEGTEELQDPPVRKSRPSLSDRTIESLASIPSSPAGKGRRRSSFFSAESPMPPPARPASALGNNRRPVTSDGTSQKTLATPLKQGSGLSQRGSLTAPGKRSVSAALPNVSTPSKSAVSTKPATRVTKQPLSQLQNVQGLPRSRPLSGSKTMTTRTPKARPSLAGVFGGTISPPDTAPSTPSPRGRLVDEDGSPITARRVSNSSAALREQIAKAKASSRSVGTAQSPESARKVSNSSGALREQIAKAKEAARRAAASKTAGEAHKEFPAVTENEHGIVPDPAEIAEFDFGLDEDPFNQRSKGSVSLLRKRIDAARMDGRLNIAAMGLNEFPEDVMKMYQFDPDNSAVAWGDVVDLTVIIAADNELEKIPDALFPDIDLDTAIDYEDDNNPQFGAVQTLDFHGNTLKDLPLGLRRLQQLTKLNLSRNLLTNSVIEVISQIDSLRDLKLADNNLQGRLPPSVGQLRHLEVLELQGNKLSSLPDEIQDLVHLRTLNVSDNQLKTIPAGLFSSVPLIELLARKNGFSGSFFPQILDTVPHLQTLQLSANSISSLCEAGTILMPALKTLDVSSNRLANLPDISTWTSLVTLLAGENKLSALPGGFTTLPNLRNADFTANDLTKLDEQIALMEGLENLTVAANPLRDRKFLTMNTEDIKRDLFSRMEPDTVDAAHADTDIVEEGITSAPTDWTLKPSGTLDLSSKGLSEIDESKLLSFAEIHDVRQLYLQRNNLLAIPPILYQLNHLTVLDLSKNSISEPLNEPLTLPRLRELRLPNNKLQSFDTLITYLSAPSLQHLDVTNNRISGTLPTLREVFPELFILMAGDNAITDISAEALTGLKIVNLSNNDIGRLPPEIGLLLGTLTSFEVEGNTFRVPNYMILQKGTDAVLSWLRDKIPAASAEEF